MKITDIREVTRPIQSNIRNAYIDFSKMTLSLVAVVTDVIRDGKPVIGYGFNSNGRYGQGALMRERFIPRVLEAAPDSLLDDTGDNESYPDLFQPYGGFSDGVKVNNGYVDLPALVGIGFEGNADLYAEMKQLAS